MPLYCMAPPCHGICSDTTIALLGHKAKSLTVAVCCVFLWREASPAGPGASLPLAGFAALVLARRRRRRPPLRRRRGDGRGCGRVEGRRRREPTSLSAGSRALCRLRWLIGGKETAFFMLCVVCGFRAVCAGAGRTRLRVGCRGVPVRVLFSGHTKGPRGSCDPRGLS